MHQEMIQRYFETCEDQMVAAITKLVAIRSVRGEAQPGLPFGKGPAEAILHDPSLKAYYQKKRDEGKHHGTAVGAVCHKLLARIFFILKEQRLYVIR